MDPTATVQNLDASLLGSTIIPPKAQKAWKLADVVQTVVASLFAAFYTVYCFADVLTPIPELAALTIERLRVISVITLPFVIVRIISNIRLLVCSDEFHWLPAFGIAGDVGLLATNLSSVISGFSKLVELTSKVAIITQWVGFIGIALQSTGLVLETVLLVKSIQILHALDSVTVSNILKNEDERTLRSIAQLSKAEIRSLATIQDTNKLIKHLKKRVSYAMAGRVVRMITILFTIAATALFLCSAPVIIPVSLGVAVVILSFVAHPSEIFAKSYFQRKLALIA